MVVYAGPLLLQLMSIVEYVFWNPQQEWDNKKPV